MLGLAWLNGETADIGPGDRVRLVSRKGCCFILCGSDMVEIWLWLVRGG